MKTSSCFRVASIFAVFLSASTLDRAARAQTAPSPDDALVQQGITLRTQGRDAEALAVFEQAHRQFATPRSLAQIALAEQALGRWLAADEHLRAALSSAQDPWIGRNRAALEGALAQLGQRLCALELIDGVQGARVRIDGREHGQLPQAARLRLVRGSYTLEIEAEGYYPLRRTIDLNGASARESVELRPRASAAGTNANSQQNNTQNSNSNGGSGRVTPVEPPRTAGVAVGGVVLAATGAVSMGLSGLLFVLRNNAEAELRTSATLGCNFTAGSWECANPAALGVHGQGNTMNAIGHGLLWGGLALASGGAAWIAISATARSPERPAQSAVLPWIGPDARGAQWVGRF